MATPYKRSALSLPELPNHSSGLPSHTCTCTCTCTGIACTLYMAVLIWVYVREGNKANINKCTLYMYMHVHMYNVHVHVYIYICAFLIHCALMPFVTLKMITTIFLGLVHLRYSRQGIVRRVAWGPVWDVRIYCTNCWTLSHSPTTLRYMSMYKLCPHEVHVHLHCMHMYMYVQCSAHEVHVHASIV